MSPADAPRTPSSPTPGAKPRPAGDGRDSHGRFAEGNGGGPGNPFARQVAGLRAALLAAVTEQDMAEVAQALVRRAKEGDVSAVKLLLSYTLGKPTASSGPVRPEQHPEQAAAPPPAAVEKKAAPLRPPLDEKELARLGRLLDLTPPPAHDVRLCQGQPAPSPKGRC
jgi:hypothetical protein